MAIIEKTASRNTISSGGSATLEFTFPTGEEPAAGDLVVFGISWRGDTTVSAAPHSLALATVGGNGAGIDSALYYKIATGSEGATWEFTFAASVKASGVASSWTGILDPAPLDAINSNTATGTAGTTGLTGALAQADELVVCLYSNINTSTWSAYDNSQVELGQRQSTGGPTGQRSNTAVTAVIVSSDASVNYGATLSASQVWSSAVATFMANNTPPPTGQTGKFFLAF